jgi:hypothetical protein
MTSQADYTNQPTDRRITPVLFPTRRFAITSRGGAMPGSSSASIGQNGNPNALAWIGLNPLEMISHLARATEEAEAQKGIASPGPLVVGSAKLNSVTPSVPVLAKEKDSVTRKNKRDVNDTMLANVKAQDIPMPLPPWDLSFLVKQDQNAAESVNQLQHLARVVESMPNYAYVGGSYQRIRAHVAGTASWIHSIYKGELSPEAAGDKKTKLQCLYADAIVQMEGLAEMTHALGPAEEEEEEENAMVQDKPELDPHEFADYMTTWLKNHWINPYPDDAGLKMMAEDCGKTTTVISNWLINARTRKWRPSIIKAFELGRPAHLLLEDATNIFEGKPLRDLNIGVSFNQASHQLDFGVPSKEASRQFDSAVPSKVASSQSNIDYIDVPPPPKASRQSDVNYIYVPPKEASHQPDVNYIHVPPKEASHQSDVDYIHVPPKEASHQSDVDYIHVPPKDASQNFDAAFESAALPPKKRAKFEYF